MFESGGTDLCSLTESGVSYGQVFYTIYLLPIIGDAWDGGFKVETLLGRMDRVTLYPLSHTVSTDSLSPACHLLRQVHLMRQSL